MAGTEGTGEYVVVLCTRLGRVGYRLLDREDSYRIRVEPEPSSRDRLARLLTRRLGWKQPGDGGGDRYSVVVRKEQFPQALGLAVQALEPGADINPSAPEWVQQIVKQAMETKSAPLQIPSSYSPTPIHIEYVHQSRIDNLKGINSENFDLKKIIRLCEELNLAYQNGCYFATAMLLRSITDHIPPIFGCKNFQGVFNNYNGGKSFKELMGKFENTLRKVADGYLHEQIRKKEELPNANSVNFSQELDKLLEEICRIL
jgi:hypothetical protein